jgi:hypothetical protein
VIAPGLVTPLVEPVGVRFSEDTTPCRMTGVTLHSHVHKRVSVKGDDGISGIRNCIGWTAFRQVASLSTSNSGVKAMIRCGGDHAM